MDDAQRKYIFDAAKKLGARFRNDADVALLNDAIDLALSVPAHPEPVPTMPAKSQITLRTALELISHEGILLEAYKDSKGIWTWGVGVTDSSGHKVLRYKDNPQPLRRVLEIYIWLLETRYLPDVLEEFAGHALTEAQLAAALSFHYNTGKIKVASWVDDWKAGKVAEAEAGIMEWRKPPEVIERRKKERDLFFKGIWSGDGKATLYDINRATYTPKWSSARRIDVSTELKQLLGG